MPNLKYRNFSSFINLSKLEIDNDTLNNLRFLTANYLNHKFDLLGSGLVKVSYNLKPNGLEGYKYYTKRNKIYNYINSTWLIDFNHISNFLKIKSIDKNYIPINWNVDFKSGFDFKSVDLKSIYKNIIGKVKGVDIKVAWELARMYHLPQIAIFAAFSKNKDIINKLIKEFRNEVLDFIVSNPYKKTIHWSSAMEVSIRAVNLLIAYDIFRQLDCNNILNYRFDKIFYEFIKKHGKYIINNLEYHSKISSNHYLSNLAGLIFIASYLKSDSLTDAWLVFATQELIEQVNYQFNSDGSHFECSTSYHRLCLEFVVYSTLLIFNIIQSNRKRVYIKYNYKLVKRLKPFKNQKYDLKSYEFFPKWYIDIIFFAGLFDKNIMNNNYEIVQIGDNDSGRLLKLTPIGKIISSSEAIKKYLNLNKIKDKYYFDENNINHSTIMALEASLFRKNIEFEKYAVKVPLEYSLSKTLLKNKVFERDNIIKTDIDFYKLGDIKLKYKKTTKINFVTLEEPINKNIKFYYYNKFGLCLFKSNLLYLAIIVDTTRHAKFYGHSHNDKLSFELIVDNKPVVRDPGTYIYTPLKEKRNIFRSVKTHNTIIVKNVEQNKFLDYFLLDSKAKAYIIEKKDCYIKLYAEYKYIKHIREFYILDHEIIINDYSNNEFSVNINNNLYSNGYGKIVNGEWLKDKYKIYIENNQESLKNIFVY